MSYLSQWKAILARIEGLLEAGKSFSQFLAVQSSDSYGTMKKILIPEAKSIFDELNKFQDSYNKSLPPVAVKSLDRFLSDSKHIFQANEIDNREGLKYMLPSLVPSNAYNFG